MSASPPAARPLSDRRLQRLVESPRSVAIAGAVALAVAMGIGRFAFTPLLPMMLADGVIDLPSASWLASANYIGYLVGALLCTFQPSIWRRVGSWAPISAPFMVRLGLGATVALTLSMAIPVPGAWPALRFAAGVASAFVFVYSAGWCLHTLAHLGAPALGGVMFTGPGAGIVVSGLAASALVAEHWRAADGWLIFGVLAALLTAWIWRTFRDIDDTAPPAPEAASPGAGSGPTAPPGSAAHPSPTEMHESAAQRGRTEMHESAAHRGRTEMLESTAQRGPTEMPESTAQRGPTAMPDAASDAGTTLPPKATPATATTLAPAAHGAPVPALRHPGEIAWLALAYGIDGFGYIITATFLPVIAREALPGSAWLDLFWPAFGAGIIVGALLSVRVPMRIDRRWLLVGCYAVQALAIAIPLWRPSLAGFAFGSLLLGLPFTAITFFAMQEVRRLRPTHAPSVMGLLTACYGIGQIVGPPLATWLLQHHASHGGGFALSLEIAAGSLLVGAAMFAAMARAYPSNRG